MPKGIYKRTVEMKTGKQSHPAWNKGKTLSAEIRNNISKGKKGKKHSIQHKENMMRTLKSPEHRQKMSEITKAKGSWGWQKNPFRWNKNKSESKKASSARRRGLIRNAEGSHTEGEWGLLKKQYGNTCPCCKQSEPIIKLTEDHIIPLTKGGSNFIENIQPLCLRCNVKKHTEIVKYEIIKN